VLPEQEPFKPLPRKGTGTHVARLQLGKSHPHFQTTSPQGDGNPTEHRTWIAPDSSFQTTSPQGDGNKEIY